MRIGIYIGTVTPSSGGAYSFLETIKRDILEKISIMDCRYEIWLVFSNDFQTRCWTKDNVTYLNLADKTPLFGRIIRRILRRFGCRSVSPEDAVLRAHGIDLVYFLCPTNLNITIPYIYTVWDLGHRMLPCFPEVSVGDEWLNREKQYQKMLLPATYIITGNEAGKREILANYSVCPDKIKIIPFPISDFCYAKIKVPEIIDDIKKPFVFYPAQFWAHKNHVSLIEAIAWLRDTKKVLVNCYFVGSDKGNLEHVQKIIKKYDLENQVFIWGFVEYSVLKYLYENALAMTFMSFMGPNNMPPLEAAALGCPLIISNIPGHIEQVGEAGLLVDALDQRDIGQAILTLYENREQRQALIKAGETLANRYTNYSYFEQMLQVINCFANFSKNWLA